MTAQTITERVATEVRAQMARHRRTQFDVAKLLGCSQTAISRRLNGEVAFDVDQLVELADYFGVAAAALLPEPLETATA